MVTMGTSNTKKTIAYATILLPDNSVWLSGPISRYLKGRTVGFTCLLRNRPCGLYLASFRPGTLLSTSWQACEMYNFRGPRGAAMQLLINFIICQERFCDPTSLK